MKLHYLILATTFLLFSCENIKKEKSKNKTVSNIANYKDQWFFEPKDSVMKVTLEQQLELAPTEEEMKWFKDGKLGIFVHWGPALSVTNVLSWG